MIEKNLSGVGSTGDGVIKAREFPDLTFKTREDLFKHLKEHAAKIIDLKTKDVRHTDGADFLPKAEVTAKAAFFQDGHVFPVINTTKYMDSHNDVHLDGVWDVSVKQQQGNVYYVVDHKLEIDSIIAHPEDVEMKIVLMDWEELGANFKGQTEALVFKVPMNKIQHQKALDIIKQRRNIQHSVRMQYLKVQLAINSTSDEFKQEKAVFDKWIYSIVNQEKAQENGYFWAVEEAKIFKEGSMVIFGSHDITPMVYPKKETDPSNPGSQSGDSTFTGGRRAKRLASYETAKKV